MLRGHVLAAGTATAGDCTPTLAGGAAVTGFLLPPHVTTAFPPLGLLLCLVHGGERQLLQLVVILGERLHLLVRALVVWERVGDYPGPRSLYLEPRNLQKWSGDRRTDFVAATLRVGFVKA